MKSTTPYWIAISILALAVTGMAFKFVVLGSTAKGDDGRTAVILESGERQVVLEEMRLLLEQTQVIVEALAEDDLAKVEAAARPIGSAAVATVDFRLRAKLPLEFKKLGFATHDAFDMMADMAAAGEQSKAIQKKLAETINNCIACHAGYQLPVNIQH